MSIAFNIDTILSEIKIRLEQQSGNTCYLYIPDEGEEPYYCLDVADSSVLPSKNICGIKYSIRIHTVIRKKTEGVSIGDMIQRLESALQEEIILEEPYENVMQLNRGIQEMKKDEWGDVHANSLFGITVCCKRQSSGEKNKEKEEDFENENI